MAVRIPVTRSISARFLLVLLMSVVPATGCGTLGLGGVNLISIEEEWEMGRQLEAEIAREMPVSQNATITRIGEGIVSQTDMAQLPWRFYVIEEDMVNAFNAPGGLVYIYRGLIDEVGGEDELAAVVAHEVGHGVERHGTQRLSQQYGLSVLAAVVLGEDPGVIQQIVAQIAAAGTVASFSRAMEHEADEFGVHGMARSGYDPRGMVTFFERLLELQEREPGSVERLFATHPAIDERIEEVEAHIAEMDADR